MSVLHNYKSLIGKQIYYDEVLKEEEGALFLLTLKVNNIVGADLYYMSF